MISEENSSHITWTTIKQHCVNEGGQGTRKVGTDSRHASHPSGVESGSRPPSP